MPAKFSIFTVATLPIIPIALACGGDDDGGGGRIMVQPDSNTNQTPDAPPAACTADTSYAALAPPQGSNANQFAESSGSGTMQFTQWGGALGTTGTMPDIIQVELYAGAGTFASGITAKSVTLSGDELNYRTCGACVRIFTDIHQNAMMQPQLTDQFFATGGTLNLTSVSGNFTGTLSNVNLTQVTVAMDFTSTPVPNGCNTAVPSLSMNAPIMAGSAAGEIPVQIIIKDRKQAF